MSANRHLGRIIALQTLFEQDFRRGSNDTTFDLDAVLERNIARYKATVEDTAFVEDLVRGVTTHEADLDTKLQPVAPEWPIAEIARMDRVLLRIGLYELTFEADVPPKVVINEAVELAKAFGSENSSKFINGVLGTLLRAQEGGETKPEPAKKKAATKKTSTAKSPKSGPSAASTKQPAKKSTRTRKAAS